ncbi:NADH dehydrogenase (ubiquinone) B8 subunit [Oratosquilla oratoria]|uniref:NADH dehydrogenase (ubiquinone) B8 subunit n=1 Tax=Oratosquilla oratoria TaxID=337810 RepID=UPI003F760E14
MAAKSAVRFAPQLKELRIHLCQNSPSSQGVRDFIVKKYIGLKLANPKFPILIRECSSIQPKAWARYEMGKETSISLANLNEGEVAASIERLATAK